VRGDAGRCLRSYPRFMASAARVSADEVSLASASICFANSLALGTSVGGRRIGKSGRRGSRP